MKINNNNNIVKNSNKSCLSLDNAISEIKRLSNVKFNESIDVHIRLNLLLLKRKIIYGYINLPCNFGKKNKILFFNYLNYCNITKINNYVDFISSKEELNDIIINKKIKKYDLFVSIKNGIKYINKYKKYLTSINKFPNKNLGLLFDDINKEYINILINRRKIFKLDKYGIIHLSIGKVYEKDNNSNINVRKLFKVILKYKPNNVNVSKFIFNIYMSSTMGKSFKIDINSL